MLILLITRIFGSRIVFTFTFYVAFTLINFSDFDVGCIFRPALVCWVIVYSDQLLGALTLISVAYFDQLLGAHLTLIYLITIIGPRFVQKSEIFSFSSQKCWECNIQMYNFRSTIWAIQSDRNFNLIKSRGIRGVILKKKIWKFLWIIFFRWLILG